MKRGLGPVFYALIWLGLTLSLVGWWLVYGLRQLDRIAALEPTVASRLLEQHRMLQWEGGSLLLLLLLGGAALFYYSLREKRRNDQVREFYATLTHELKTPLASLRLQAESLEEDLGDGSHSRLIQRLIQDTVRLELQLENALFLASVRNFENLHLENLSLKECIGRLKVQWPEIHEDLADDIYVRGDRRALDGILKNLLQNARVHGRASQISIGAGVSGSRVKLSVRDDGRGFAGPTESLGQLFARPTADSGSGVGLYLSKTLALGMKGQLRIVEAPTRGFGVEIDLERGELA